MKMESLPVSKFKAICLAVLEEVAQHKKRFVITKHGKPIAEVVPYEEEPERRSLRDTVVFIDDIISPVAVEDWETLK
jgi:prevent-host-death family protein